jgi:hypothetical protein
MYQFNAGVECILNAAICAMREAFSATSTYPPIGGGTNDVRLVAGDGAAMAAVDVHINECECGKEPFLWVRLVRRYRSRVFPQPFVGADGCGTPVVVAVEVGVVRCAILNPNGPTWKELADEAEISLDDSGRIELALCRAATIMREKNCSDLQGFDSIVPTGPEGGVVGWIGTMYAAVST